MSKGTASGGLPSITALRVLRCNRGASLQQWVDFVETVHTHKIYIFKNMIIVYNSKLIFRKNARCRSVQIIPSLCVIEVRELIITAPHWGLCHHCLLYFWESPCLTWIYFPAFYALTNMTFKTSFLGLPRSTHQVLPLNPDLSCAPHQCLEAVHWNNRKLLIIQPLSHWSILFYFSRFWVACFYSIIRPIDYKQYN